jgi:glycosyltransferase involved in cell wall biosynthesis
MGAVERRAVDIFLPESQAVAVGNGLVGGDAPYEVIPVFVADDIGVPRGDAAPYLAQLPADDFLLFVGAFGSYKGVDVLLRAYAGLQDAPPLVIIGYETTEYPVATTDLPPNVTVLKNWPHHAVMAAWRRCLLGLVPSIWAEPFGLVALEAMASGRPVIASRIGGLTDIVVDGETGLLVPPGDTDALRGAMARLLADPALRQRFGNAGRQRVARFQAATVIPQIERVYDGLLAGAPVGAWSM